MSVFSSVFVGLIAFNALFFVSLMFFRRGTSHQFASSDSPPSLHIPA
jgi:hypothetical protein